MKTLVYARVSTRDKDQDPETQLSAIRHWLASHPDWPVVDTFIDIASANDFGRRTGWRDLQDAIAHRKGKAVVVFKLDRAFRSVRHLHQSLEAWEPYGVQLVSVTEGFDSRTAMGRLLINLLGSLAEFELEVLRDRVVAGMDRARAQGRQIGRPPALRRPFVEARWPEVREAVAAGRMGTREAARFLGVSPTWVSRRVHAGDVPETLTSAAHHVDDDDVTS